MVEFGKFYSLRRLGLAFAALWLIVLIAALGALIFREIDGTTVRSVSSENLTLSSRNVELSDELSNSLKKMALVQDELASTRVEVEQLRAQISASDLRHAQTADRLSQFMRRWPLKSAVPNIE